MTFASNKIFVLDTSVILYDHQCIYRFAEHHVVIPITLLEELEHFTRGNETIHYNAREFYRELDILFKDRFPSEGADLESGGTISVNTNVRKDDFFEHVFWEDCPDHRILLVAYNLGREFGSDRVTLVSKDINLRMKAKSIGVQADDYKAGKVKNIDDLYSGKTFLDGMQHEVIDIIFRQGSLGLDEAGLDIAPQPNQYFIMRNGSKSVLATYRRENNALRMVEKKAAYGVHPRNAEQTFSLDALMNPDIRLVTLSGQAGTGKTLMALAAALEMREEYKQILLARPIVSLSNKGIGYLPGDITTKLDPHMQPLFDNLAVIKHQFSKGSAPYKRIDEMLKNEDLMIMPLAFIRGRSLSHVFFIVDEAQNLTPHEVKTIITRAGEGTKIVFTGDPYQIDTPYLDARSNGLTYLVDKMKGQDVYAHIMLRKGERSQLAELASCLL